MTDDDLKAIKQRIDLAKSCYGETFDGGRPSDGEAREVVDVIRDRDREALYLEVMALSDRGEIVNACAHCGANMNQMERVGLPHFAWWCKYCRNYYNHPAYYQRVKGPTS